MAEDDEIVAEIARDALIAAGHGVGILSDGVEALRVIRARKPDLVILDCNMPELSGLLVLRQMRDSPELHAMPVLVLTARDSRRDEEIAFYEGADDYMRKPFEPDQLVFRVEQLLTRKAARS